MSDPTCSKHDMPIVPMMLCEACEGEREKELRAQIQQIEKSRDQLADEHEFLKAKMARTEIQLVLNDMEAKEARTQTALFYMALKKVTQYSHHHDNCEWRESDKCDCGYLQSQLRAVKLWGDWEEQE